MSLYEQELPNLIGILRFLCKKHQKSQKVYMHTPLLGQPKFHHSYAMQYPADNSVNAKNLRKAKGQSV